LRARWARPRSDQRPRGPRAVGRKLRGDLFEGVPATRFDVHLGQAGDSRAESGLLGQGGLPLAFRVVGFALVPEDEGELVTGLVAAETGVEAGEVLARPHFQERSPGSLGPAQVARRA
jgi:hypothetical protein